MEKTMESYSKATCLPSNFYDSQSDQQELFVGILSQLRQSLKYIVSKDLFEVAEDVNTLFTTMILFIDRLCHHWQHQNINYHKEMKE